MRCASRPGVVSRAGDGFGPDVLGTFGSRLTQSDLVVFPGMGHFGPLEDPPVVAASVERTLVPEDVIPEA